MMTVGAVLEPLLQKKADSIVGYIIVTSAGLSGKL
jgi:hypothetical protein